MDRRPSPHRENWAAWVSLRAVISPPLRLRQGAVRTDDERPDRALEQDPGGSPVAPDARLGGFGAAFLHRDDRDRAALAPVDQTGDQDDPAASVPPPESNADVRAQFALETPPGFSLAERGEAKLVRPLRYLPAPIRRGDEALVRKPERRVGVRLPSEPVGAVKKPVGQHPHRGRRAVPAIRDDVRLASRARCRLGVRRYRRENFDDVLLPREARLALFRGEGGRRREARREIAWPGRARPGFRPS